MFLKRKIKLLLIAVSMFLISSVSLATNPTGKLIGGGFILLNDVCYTRANYEPENVQVYNTILEVLKGRFPNSRVFAVPVPMSQLLIEDIPNFNISLVNQNEILNNMQANIGDKVKVVNACTKLLEHRNEYIYFKTDPHWTQRGAYYAYAAFCEGLNQETLPLTSYTEALLNSSYKGVAYSTTQNEKIKDKRDELYAYVSNIPNNVKVYNNNNKLIKETVVVDPTKVTYAGAFISGDNPFTVIHADNNKNKSALVIKDSYGCAFIPFMIQDYSDIFVVDPRYSEFNVITKLKDFNIDDVFLITGIYQASDVSFMTKIAKLIEDPALVK